jgi:hypothetical protein
MKSVLFQVTLYILIFNSVRFGILIREQARQSRESARENALMPRDGTFQAVDTGGTLQAPRLGDNGHLLGGGHLLVFVIHHAFLERDTEFWNRVIKLVGGAKPKTIATLQYWGVCDEGSGCSQYESVARFSLFGYLEPYQMHTVARADEDREALLYDQSMTLKARIPIAPEPSEVSALVVAKVK